MDRKSRRPLMIAGHVCRTCRKPLVRKRFSGGTMEDYRRFSTRVYCDQVCMAKGMIKASVTLAALRVRAKKFRKARCEECGGREKLSIHHLDQNPQNNAPGNLKTLCNRCHQLWHWRIGNRRNSPKRRIAPPCTVCGAKSRRRRMCQTHFFRWKKYGDPLLTKRLLRIGVFELVRVDPTAKLRSAPSATPSSPPAPPTPS